MSVRLVLVCVVIAVSAGSAGSAGAARRHEERAQVGAFVFGLFYGLPATVATATLIGTRDPSCEDRRMLGALLIPAVGPAITGVMIVESHPLTWVVGGFLWVVAAAQTAGLVMLLSGVAGMAAGPRRNLRHRNALVLPVVAPAGIGLAGVF